MYMFSIGTNGTRLILNYYLSENKISCTENSYSPNILIFCSEEFFTSRKEKNELE